MTRPILTERAVARHSTQLLMRSALLVIAGLLALLNPDAFFLDALLGVSAVAIVFGAYEMTIHGAGGDGLQYGRIPKLNGFSTLAFGLVSVLLTFTTFRTGMIVLALWLCLHALVLLGISRELQNAQAKRTELKAVPMARWVLGALAFLHMAAAFIAIFFANRPRFGSLVLPGSGAMYALALGVWCGVCGLWLRRSVRAWKYELPTVAEAIPADIEQQSQRSSSSIPAMQVLVIGAALLSACTPVLSNVSVRGDPRSVAQLVGQWEGDYRSQDTGRSGFITFNLRAGTDTAQGDVIMTYRTNAISGNGGAEYARVLSSSMQVLTVRFVVAQDGEVLGILDPYNDPDCGCSLRTRFRGRLRGDEIKGYYESYSAEVLHRPASGEWSVRRTPRDSTAG